MTYTPPPSINSGDPAVNTDWNTYVRANFIELESRKEASFVVVGGGTPVTISATVEASSTTIVTAGAVTANGTDVYEVQFYCCELSLPGNASGNSCVISLFDGANQIGRIGMFSRTDTGTDTRNHPVFIVHRLIPSNGSHTYSVRAFRTNVNCVADNGVGGTGAAMPIYIRVLKVQ
jgi:hypothetical protein